MAFFRKKESALSESKVELPDITPIQSFIKTVNKSQLAQQIKNDVNKVMLCLIYIRNHIPLIKEVADNKKPYPAEDQQKGVLRDQNKTSFHVKIYKDGKEAEKNLLAIVQQVSHVLSQLKNDQWMMFARKLQYDDNVGCLDQRLSIAMKWAEDILILGIPSLDDIMQQCYVVYSQNSKNHKLFSQFAIEYFKENDITVFHKEGKKVPLTIDIIVNYAKTILGEETDEVKEVKIPVQNHWPISPEHIFVSNQNKLNLHFKTKEEAKEFINKELKNVSGDLVIEQETLYTIKKITPYFSIKLNERQIKSWLGELGYNLIFHSNIYNTENNIRLLSEEKGSDSPNSILNMVFLLYYYQPLIMMELAYFYHLYSFSNKLESDLFKKLINTFSPHVCKKIATYEYDASGNLLFNVIALNQSNEVLTNFIKKLDNETCNDIALKNSDVGKCAFTYVTLYHDANTFITFLNKLSKETCKKIANQSLMVFMIIHYQSQKCMSFLNKFDSYTIFNMVQKIGVNQYLLTNIANTLSSEDFEVILSKIKTSNKKLTFPAIGKMVSLFSAVLFNQSKSHFLNFLTLLDDDTLNHLGSFFAEQIFINKLTRILLKALDEKIIDFKKELPDKVINLLDMLKHISRRHNLDYFPKPFLGQNIKPSLDEKMALNYFNSGRAAIKIMTKKSWSILFKQLDNYQHREPLRKKSKDKEGYKYVHLTGEIIKMRSAEDKKIHKSNKNYQNTKKMSFTLISSKLHTGFYGDQNASMTCVGIACLADKPKMMWKNNAVSYERAWVSKNLYEVSNYANLALSHSFSRQDKFKHYVDTHPGSMNEILIPVNVNEMENRIFAIVIAEDNPKARCVARTYQKKYEEHFKINLPIVFYQPEYRRVGIYTHYEQLVDEVQFQIYQARLAKFKFSTSISINAYDIKTRLTQEEADALLNFIKNNKDDDLQALVKNIHLICNSKQSEEKEELSTESKRCLTM